MPPGRTPSLREVPGATTVVVVTLVAAALALFAWAWTHTVRSTALPATRTPVSQASVDPAAYAAGLRAAVDEERVRARRPRLTDAACASAVAVQRADLLIGQRLEHAPLDTVHQACPGAQLVRENLSRAQQPPGAVVAGWMASAPQRADLLDPAAGTTAVACTHDGDAMLCVQLYLGDG